ncbi:hypothetical protein [Sporosarcina sp. FSL W7-1283]|uniref:hypothetical protein n=1 Tax=Sporosarcina sp. FSL W7-1283 TaxID=2921560 RepID=UPI0030F7FB71
MSEKEQIRETEMKLDELSKRVEEKVMKKNIPLFEVFVTLYSILVSIMILQFPSVMEIMVIDHGSEGVLIFEMLLDLANPWVYGVIFFIAGAFKGLGLVIDNAPMRVVGLLLSVALYSTFTLALMFNAPSFILISFFTMSIFSTISLTLVKSTGISLKQERTETEELEKTEEM